MKASIIGNAKVINLKLQSFSLHKVIYGTILFWMTLSCNNSPTADTLGFVDDEVRLKVYDANTELESSVTLKEGVIIARFCGCLSIAVFLGTDHDLKEIVAMRNGDQKNRGMIQDHISPKLGVGATVNKLPFQDHSMFQKSQGWCVVSLSCAPCALVSLRPILEIFQDANIYPIGIFPVQALPHAEQELMGSFSSVLCDDIVVASLCNSFSPIVFKTDIHSKIIWVQSIPDTKSIQQVISR